MVKIAPSNQGKVDFKGISLGKFQRPPGSNGMLFTLSYALVRIRRSALLGTKIARNVFRVASESANTRGDRNQVHRLRSTVTSVRGKANRHPSTRVFGSPVVLDDWRSRKQAARFQGLLQQPSHAYLTGRANAGYAGVTTNRKSPFVSMAAPLPILVSDPNGCLTLSKARAHCGIRSTSKNTWNEIIQYLRSWL